MNYPLNYNAVFTTNINELKNLRGIVCGHVYTIKNKNIITNLLFDKVYYIYYKDKLVAFKLIAFSMIKEQYLLETPYGLLWVNLKYYRIFLSKEHYFKYLNGISEPIHYEENETNIANISEFSQEKCNPKSFTLKTSYKWNNSLGKPIEENSKIYDVFYTKIGFVVYYDLYNNSYHTYEECLQANLNGMEICEFGGEDTTIHFQIETEKRPKIHILRFIEE